MSDLEFWKDLGNIFDAVLNYQKKNVEFNNRFINPWIRLGNIFEREDRNQEAVEVYKHATQIDPDNAQNWSGLGDAHFKAGAYDEAVVSYQRSVTLDPEAGWPLGNLALTLVTQGKVEEAIPLYLNAINLMIEPKDKAICWNRLGNAYRKINNYDNATQAFMQADLLDGDNAGLDDKMDEAPEASTSAPEEILEQVLVAPAVEEESAPVSAPAEEPALAEPEAIQLEQVEVESETIALAPNMEMSAEVVDEMTEDATVELESDLPVAETAMAEEIASATDEQSPMELHEKFDSLKMIEEIIAKVEAEYAPEVEAVAETEPVMEEVSVLEVEAVAETESVIAEVFAPEVEAIAETEPVAEEVSAPEVEAIAETEPVVEEVSAPEVEAVAETEPVAEEESVQAVETIAETESAAEVENNSPKLPAWLAIKHKMFGVESESQKEDTQAASVTTLSDIPQNVAVNESTLEMDVVETYADPLMVHLSNEEPVLNSESVEKVEAVQASAVAEESFEAYLKDEDEALTDHVDEIQTEAPLAQVSENGEVRIAMDTNNAHVWNELGNVYLNAGSYDEAIAAYRKAIDLDRRFAWPYSNLALAYVHKGSFAEAILLYQRGIELFNSDKDKAITWNRLGSVYRRINDYDNAIESYKIADELDPDNATLSLRASFGLLGNAYSEQKTAYVA